MLSLAWGLAACTSTDRADPRDPISTDPTTSTPEPTPTSPALDSGTAGPEDSGGWIEGESTGPCADQRDEAALELCAEGGYAAIHRSTGYGSVLQAIEASSSGDTIRVCPGQWTLSGASLNGRELVAADPSPEATILDADGGTVLTAIEGAVRGITVTGAGNGGVAIQGLWSLELECVTARDNPTQAVFMGSGELVVRHSTFTGNGDTTIFAPVDVLTIEDSSFSDNAGGIVAAAQTTIRRTTIEDGFGVAIDWARTGSLTVEDSVVRNHVAALFGRAGAIGVNPPGASTLTVARTTFDSNYGLSAGAIDLQAADALVVSITDTTFTGNTGEEAGGLGFTGAVAGPLDLTLTGAAFTDNVATAGGGALAGGDTAWPVAIVAAGLVALRNDGGTGAAIALRGDDVLSCTACDLGTGADDNTPADAMRDGEVTATLDGTFTF